MADARIARRAPPAGTPSSVWPAQSIAALAGVEERSGSLRDLSRRDAGWRRHGRLLVRADVDPKVLPVRPPDGEGETWEVQVPIAADAVLLSTLPGSRVSCRAFYLDAGLTVTLRRATLHPSQLLRGARVAARFHGDGPLLVPRQIDRGRGLHVAWVVEELLDGVTATRRRWPSMVDRVSEGAVAMWRRAHTRRRQPRRIVPWLSAVAVADRIEALGVMPSNADGLARAIGTLEHDTRACLVGWTHGDPVPNNVLELEDGRLALVDWERAGRNPLGLDACRLLAALDEPGPAIDRLEDRFASMRPNGVLPVRLQAAVGLVGLLPTWANQREAWHAAGRATGYRVRNARRVRLLEQLLGVGGASGSASEQGPAVAGEGSD
jgi:hypothetical protein